MLYDKPKIDLFIINVNMTEVDSIELKNMISQMYEETNIVFVTDNDSNMRDAFGNKKVHLGTKYLVKCNI